jgi:tRNA threonylcarbamoyladenosine biosynthesis protein TsaE
MEVITKNAEGTKSLGRKIATDLKGKIFVLTGDLGSGKTTFTQGFAEGLGIKNRIISPTFILMRKYPMQLKSQNSNLKTTIQNLELTNFYHLDLYRLEKNIENEIENLGVKDIWKDKKNVMIIEWAEKIKNLLPKETIWIKFENLGENERKITIE